MNCEHKFEIFSSEELRDLETYPAGTKKLVFRSAFDGKTDWALFLPGDTARNTVVYMHGSFSYADQIFTRRDVRNFWLRRIVAGLKVMAEISKRNLNFTGAVLF